MKKTLITLIAIVSITITSIAQNVNIPDANFKAKLLINTSINTDADKLEFFYTVIHNYQIQNNVSEQDFFVHSRDKRQILEILGIAVDAFGTLFGSFNAYEIQKL